MNEPLKLDMAYQTLQGYVVDGFAAFVLGPGCQRVGFDAASSPGWSKVVDRMRRLVSHDSLDSDNRSFLEAFWRAKLSDETVEQLETIPAGPASGDAASPDQIALEVGLGVGPTEKASITDQIRVEYLALPLFRLFSLGTQRLGHVIRQGTTPVEHWHQVTDRELRRPDGKPGEGPGLDQLLGAAQELLDNLSALADGYRGTSREINFPTGKLTYAEADERTLQPFVTGLRLSSVRVAVEGFTRYCVGDLQAGETYAWRGGAALTGASVEWLGDLLWHLLVCDAAVPPSQRELAFLVNVPGPPADVSARHFSRARPGEFRVNSLVERDKSVIELLTSRGVRIAHQKPTSRLACTYATLAATMVQLRENKANTKPKPAGDPLAFVEGFDLLLERYLLDLLGQTRDLDDPDAPPALLHVVVPINKTGANAPSRPLLDWVVVSIEAGSTPSAKQVHDAPRTIRWLGDVEFDGNPIVVRSVGAPFLPLKAGVPNSKGRLKQSDLGLGVHPHHQAWADYKIGPALVLDEYEAALATKELRDQIRPNEQGTGGVPSLTKSLAWEGRSWMFLGEGFPEWISRLRLLQLSTLQGGAQLDSEPRDEFNALVAIDREFSWPEGALLSALNVNSFSGDLGDLVSLATRPASGPQNQEFYGKVRARVESLGLLAPEVTA